MLETIQLKNIATYDQQGVIINDLKEVNFIYGANGCGKTTLSNYLTDTSLEKFKDCSVTWKNNNNLPIFVYNKNFREKNFSTSNIAGVFTLGEATTTEINEINSLTAERNNQNTLLINSTRDKKKKELELSNIDTEFTDKCWSLYKKYENNFKGVFKGSQKKELFKRKILELSEINSTNIPTYTELLEKKDTFLKERKSIQPLMRLPDFQSLEIIEKNEIWHTAIIGKQDIDLAKLIKELDCQDWVNHGRLFIQNSTICPFCQENTINDDFRIKLESFFDNSFKEKNNFLKTISSEYIENVKAISSILTNNSSIGTDFLDENLIVNFILKYEKIVEENIVKLNIKINNPNSKLSLTSTKKIADDITFLINEYNKTITLHNNVIQNFEDEEKKFFINVWLFLKNEISSEINEYKKNFRGKSKAISILNTKIIDYTNKILEYSQKIIDLGKNITSVQPTVDQMNSLLKAYGFLNFKIVQSLDLKNHYVIQRENGDLAFESLSEGEVTFITFLYFTQLINGSLNQNNITDNRIVIIDDPISSLDSNILYIVSAIIKGLIKEIKESKVTSSIKQIIVLTHNVYFHKEASFINGRSNGCKHTHYWILNKSNNITAITEYKQKNPINSSYELIWKELKNQNNRSLITMQNTMRRIIENYFKILGKFDDKDIISTFEKIEDQQVCLALLYWINDGSHCIPEDLYISSIDDKSETYLRVFKEIFIRSGHEAHYNMMMQN